MKIKFLNLLFLFSICFANAGEFRFYLEKGSNYSVTTTVVQDIYKNSSFSHTATLLNRSIHSVVSFDEELATVRSKFYLSEKKSTTDYSYELDRTYESLYKQNVYGEHSEAEGFFMPVVRSIPSFPEDAIYPGDRWVSKGSEMHDFRTSYSIDLPFEIPATVLYEYVEDKTIDGRKFAIFSIKHSVYRDLGVPPTGKKQYPLSVYGTSVKTLTWDISLGMPNLIVEDFHYTVRLSDGQKIEHKGKSRSEFKGDGRVDRQSLLEKLILALKEEGLEPKVELSSDGIIIVLEDVMFNPDSSLLRENEEELLSKLSTVLKQFQSFPLLITGHTALAGTEAGRLNLSKQRAKVVAEYLIKSEARTDTEIMTDGKGASVPRADNSTAEGMRANRRVEIKLLTNFGEPVDVDALKKRLEEAQFN